MGSPETGGSRSARGLRFQYQRTVIELLDLLEAGAAPATTVHVESEPAGVGPVPDVDAVDYVVVAPDRVVLKRVQVKSVVDPTDQNRALSAPAALRVLLRLASDVATRYELVTNAPLTQPAQRLATCLSDGAPSLDALRGELLRAAGDSSALAHEVGHLTEENVQRLARARVVVNPQSGADARADLETRLRAYRRHAHSGIAHAESRLLAAYLVDLILTKSQEPTGRVLTLGAFQDVVLTEPLALARAIGEFDGLPVGETPWIPDIDRPTEFTALDDWFARLDHSPGPRRCAVIGPSGLGKTSLAVMYAYGRRDLYDFVLWLNAESEESVRLAVDRILESHSRWTDAAAGGPADRPETCLKELLARYAGRWLVVYDGAADLESIRAWCPSQGQGDVLVTSTNRATWAQFHRIPLAPMSSEQSVELLARRLGAGNELADTDQRAQLELLAETLEHWPLALELAAGYMLGRAWTAREITTYLDILRSRALDAGLAVPASYPRTLVAAIALCLDRVADRTRRTPGSPAALHALAAAALLASNHIPAALLLDCATPPPAGDVALDSPPGERDGGAVAVEDMISLLRSESLATVDHRETAWGEPLRGSKSHGVMDAFAPTLSVNEIIQQVVRQQYDADYRTGLLEHVAYSVNRWLVWLIEHDRPADANAMVPHASALADHSQQLDVKSMSVAILFGNLATIQAKRGLPEHAERLLTLELAYVDAFVPSPTHLHVTIHQALAFAKADAGAPVEEVINEVNAAVAAIEHSGIAPRAVVDEIENLIEITHGVVAVGAQVRLLEAVRKRLCALLGAAGVTARSALSTELRHIEQLIADDRDREAAELAEDLLRRGDLSRQGHIRAQRYYGEASAWISDWGAATASATRLHELGVQTPLESGSVLDALLQIALAASFAADFGNSDALAVQGHALALARGMLHDGIGSRSDRARFFALTANCAHLGNDRSAAGEALDQFDEAHLPIARIARTDVYVRKAAAARRWLEG